MDPLFSIILTLAFPLLLIVAMVIVVIRRGFQVKQLAEDGIDTTATVIRKVKFRGSRSPRRYALRYRYFDQFGRSHEHRSMVTKDFHDGHEEGGHISVVYSESKPHISAPKDLVEQVKAGMAKRSARNASAR